MSQDFTGAAIESRTAGYLEARAAVVANHFAPEPSGPTHLAHAEGFSFSYNRSLAAACGGVAVAGLVSASAFAMLNNPSNPGERLTTSMAMLADGEGDAGASTTEVSTTAAEAPEDPIEPAYDIAAQGSCSPYTRQNAIDAANGKFTPFGDFLVVQTDYLNQHPKFNDKFSEGARQRVPYLYQGLKLDKEATMADVTAHEDYKQGVTVEQVKDVQNTYCDEQGNVLDYQQVTLETGTGVAGIEITDRIERDGKTFLKLDNGEEIEQTDAMLIGKVKLLDGEEVEMLITNKLGLKAKANIKGEEVEVLVGCDNVLTQLPPRPDRVPTTQPQTTTAPSTTVPGTTPTTNETTTTLPDTTTTLPNTTTTQPNTTTTRGATTTVTTIKTTPTTPVGEVSTTVTAGPTTPRNPTTTKKPATTTRPTRPGTTTATTRPETGRSSTTVNND